MFDVTNFSKKERTLYGNIPLLGSIQNKKNNTRIQLKKNTK